MDSEVIDSDRAGRYLLPPPAAARSPAPKPAERYEQH